MTDRESLLALARAERRRYKRVVVNLSGRLFVPGDEREARCTVIDMSPGGAHVACEFVPDTQTPVVIYIDGFGRFEAVVSRPAEGSFGVHFNCSANKRERIAEQLMLHLNGAPVDETVVRRHDRTATKGLARFTRATGEIVACEVVDLSLGGVSLKTEQRPPIGEFVLIGQMAGRIARHHTDGIAIEFVTPSQDKQSVDRIQPKLIAVR